MKTLAVISIVLVVAAGAGETLGQVGTALSCEPPTQTVGLGSLVDVSIRKSNLTLLSTSLSAFSLDIAYDPTVLAFSTATYGDPSLGDQLDLGGFGSVAVTTLITPGLVNLSEVSLDSPADLDSLQAPQFFLAALRFSAIGAGTSPLSFASDSLLFDSVGNPLTVAYATGSVTVTPATVPVPSAVLLGSLGLGSAGWLLRRKHGMKN